MNGHAISSAPAISRAPAKLNWRHRANQLSLPLLLVGLCVAIIVFIAFYLHWDRGYIWLDEVFSLRVTEKTRSVWAMQTQLLGHETNPPLHFWLLYGFRRLIDEPRAAGHALNFVVAALSASAIAGLSWRAGRPRLGILLVIVYLMSASTMSFMQDIRDGFTTLSLCAVAVTLSGTVRLKGAADRTDLILAAGLGLLTGISHVYGALFLGCLAAALVIEAVVKRNRSQVVFGLVTGAACTLTFAAWFAGLWLSTKGRLDSIAWLAQFPPMAGFVLVWLSYLGPTPGYEIGPHVRTPGYEIWPHVWLWYLAPLGFVVALGSAVFRRSVVILVICAIMVVGIALLVSIKTPIILFRYFLILGPPLHLLLALAVYDQVRNYFKSERPGRLTTLTTLGGCVALTIPIVTSAFAADVLANYQDPWWAGVDRVRAEAGNCPSHTIRVDMTEIPVLADDMKWGFTYLLKGTGLKLEDGALSTKDVSDINCSVVGWGEHMMGSGAGLPGWPTEDNALRLMNLTNKKHAPLKIDRHMLGFVIYKAKP